MEIQKTHNEIDWANIVIVGYSNTSFLTVDYLDHLEGLLTKGCGCCSTTIPLTDNNLKKAIVDAEEWLVFLKSLSPTDINKYEECDQTKTF